jgi:hypothetical protein
MEESGEDLKRSGCKPANSEIIVISKCSSTNCPGNAGQNPEAEQGDQGPMLLFFKIFSPKNSAKK